MSSEAGEVMRDEPGRDGGEAGTGEPVAAAVPAPEAELPVGEPAAGPVVEPAAESAGEPAAGLVAEPAAEPTDSPEQVDVPGESGEALPEAPPDPVAELAAAVAALTEQVREHHDRAAARERVIDKLHAEVERLRTGEQNLVLRPITTDLQNLRKDLLHQARTLPAELGRQQVADLLESFALSAEQALERCGSAPIHPEVGAEFSAREHRAIKVLPAEDPAQHERIAAVISDGYLDTTTDRVTVPARVHVYRWSGETAPAAENDPRAEGMSADV